MLYLTHRPAAPLDEFVENLWLFSDAPSHAHERIVPSGTFELVINLEEDQFRIYASEHGEPPRRYAGAVISGAFRRAFVIDTREHASVIGVHFKPGGAFPFLGVRADELADGHVELETLWHARDARRLRERLCAASAAAERFRLLEDALRGHLFRPLQRRRAVLAALDQLDRPDVSVGDIAERAGLSHRRFIEVFGAEVGMTPRLFLRVRRFQRALALAGQRWAPPWAQLALACGYFDQSHLIRDFVEFAGVSPTDYVRLRSERIKDGHIAVARRGSNLSNTGPSARSNLDAGGSDASQARELTKR